jgi:PKD repeat protein
LQADDPSQYYIISGTFGEIHPAGTNYPDHFHKAMDINCTENNVNIRPIENGWIDDKGASSIVLGHGNYIPNVGYERTSKYLHINPNTFTIGQFVTAGQTILGIVDGSNNGTNDHLHIEMKVWNTTENRYDYVNPLDNGTNWVLTLPQGHEDNCDPVINNILIEPMNNEPNQVQSGYRIQDPNNHGGLTIVNNQTQFLNAHIHDSYFSTGNTYNYPVEKIVVWGNIGFIVNTRDLAINYPTGAWWTLGGGRGLTIQRLKYEIAQNNNYYSKYIVDFKTINPSERDDIDQCFHIPYFDPAHYIYGNNDYIELRSTDNTYLQIHEQIEDHTGQDINSNGIWFTKADNTTQHIFNETPINTAQVNELALYKDGEHELRFTVSDIDPEHDQTTNFKILVDNFLPFIKNVEIRKHPEGIPVYTRSWYWNGSTYLFEPPPCPGCPDITDNNNLYVRVNTSEGMTGISMSLNGNNIDYTTVNTERTEWNFMILPNQLVLGENTLQINGTDLAANSLINYPPHIPIRQQNGNWLPDPAPHTAADENHTFYVNEANSVDFDATQLGTGMFDVYFEDKSTMENIDSYYWQFGDGGSSNLENVIHSYLSPNTWSVTHKINVSGNEHSITKNVPVNQLEIPDADFIYTMVPQNDRSGEVIVDFYDESEGIITDWHWDFGNGSTSNQQNPEGISFEMFTHYNIRLEVENHMGVSITKKKFYYDPATSPMVQIIDWHEIPFYYNFDVHVTNLNPPFIYEIDFGDGTNESISGESQNWTTFDHQYTSWGDYLVTAHVTGTNANGHTVSVFSAKEISVVSWDLQVNLSFTAPTSPPHPGCQEVSIFAEVSGAGNVSYWGNWYIYKLGDPEFYFSQNSGSGTTIPPLIFTFPEEGRYIVGFDATTLESGGAGHDEILIEVENAPQYIEAGFYPLEPIYLGTNVTQNFESSVWPVGSPGVPEANWYPTNLRWTLFDPNGNIVPPDDNNPNEEFDWDLFYFVYSETYTFTQEGSYVLRLEAWNNTHNYQEDGLLGPECVNTLSYYDFTEKEIIVTDDLAYLQITEPEPPAYFKLDAYEHDIIIKLTNPGNNDMLWTAEPYDAMGNEVFCEITSTINTTIQNGAVGTIHARVFENEGGETRYGAVLIRGYNDDGSEVLGSPAYVYIDQSGTDGPRSQFVYSDYPYHNENFGRSVAVDGNYAVIGACHDDGSNGKAFIAKRNEVGIWRIVAKLEAADGYKQQFGRAVDIHGQYVIVGAYNRAYIFKKPASDWGGTVHSIASSSNTGNYGRKVSIWGDYAVVSAHESDKVKILYRNQGSSVDSWGLTKTLTGAFQSDFGYNIDLDNDLLAIGVPKTGNGEIRIYNRNHNSANDWGLEHIFSEPYEPNNAFLGGKGFDIYDNRITYVYRTSSIGPVPQIKGKTIERGEDHEWSNMVESFTEDETRYDEIDNFVNLAGNNCALNPRHYYTGDEYTGLYSKAYDIMGDGGDIVGGSVATYPWKTWTPSDQDYTIDLWNTNSNFGYGLETDYNTITVGGPNKDSDHIPDCGAVFFSDVNRFRSLCEAGIELDFINFEKPAGNYDEVKALKITMGGNGYDAIIKNGAEIIYAAEEIILEDGFLAANGSEFTAKSIICSGIPEELRLPDYYEAINSQSHTEGLEVETDKVEWDNMLMINIQNIRKLLAQRNPYYNWYQMDFIKGIDAIEILDKDNKVIQSIKEPNPVICFFDKKELPDLYKMVIVYDDKKFLVGSYQASK